MLASWKYFSVLLLAVVVLVRPEAGDSASPIDEVTIRRDRYGIPHLLAKTEEAAAFGFGYAQAEDHCVEIARRYIRARGEEAKYFGTGIDNDFLVKQFDNYEVARRNFGQLSPLFQRMVNAYAAGFNRYVAQHRQELPGWIPAFDGVDVIAHSRAGSLGNISSQATINALRRKYTPSPPPDPGESLDLSDAAGSNAFALAPSRTTSGRAILLGNPHLNWSSLYWEAQVTVPGKINFFGSTLAGIPVLRAGFNEHLGWVTTNNAPDLTDVIALTLDPARPDHYLFEGASRPLQSREIAVEVKGADGAMRTERRTFQDSHLGPVIYRTSAKAFTVRSTLLDAFRYFEGFYLLSRTRNLREFLDVMRLNLVPTSNFTYADAKGNILYLWNGRVPKRLDDGTSYALDVPGETAKYLWQGLHPLADFPQLLNPRGGYIQNCNNPPWYTSLRDPLDPQAFPSYFERGELALRPQLALEMLESQPKFSLEDVMRLKYNDRMLLADRVKPDLVKALQAAPAPSDDLRLGLEVIEAWDNRAAAESRGAVLFERFWETYRKAVKQPFAIVWDAQQPARTPAGLADPAASVRQFEEAVRWARATYGSPAVAWGETHRFRFKEVDLPADGATGALGMFRVMGFSQTPEGKRIAGWVGDDKPLAGFGDGWVLAVEFARPVRAHSVLAYGQTTNPASPHSRDQIRLFANHQYKRVWFTEAEIKANLERAYHP